VIRAQGKTVQFEASLAHSLSPATASVQEMAKKICHVAARTHADIKDAATGVVKYAVNFLPRPLNYYAEEEVKWWVRISMLEAHVGNQAENGRTVSFSQFSGMKSKTVVAEGSMLGFGMNDRVCLTIIGRMLYVDLEANTAEIMATAVMKNGRDILEKEGEARILRLKLHKISKVALYKPWSTK
jgi:hypothetical protein